MIVCACSQASPRKRSLKGSNLRGKALYSRAQAQLQRLPRERGLLLVKCFRWTLPTGQTKPRWLADFATENIRNTIMKFPMIAAVMLAALPALAISSPSAEAKGCLKGAVVGGVAGHYAGHHGVMGAIGGCVVGHHMANEKAKEAPQGAQNAPSAPASTTN
jgi:hypothetical protein